MCTYVGWKMALAFRSNLQQGQEAELQIGLWLRRARGYSILPIYEKEGGDFKGPRFFAPGAEFIAPDMLVMKGSDIRWIEAKRKTVFSWRGVGGYWETGIDAHHYGQYQAIAKRYPWPIWLLFLHTSDKTDPRDIARWGAPVTCPTGLFGRELAHLKKHERYGSEYGKGGMVYWRKDVLQLIATLEEVRAACKPA